MAITPLIPSVWSARITRFLADNSAFLPNANREYEGDAVMGNTIKIPTVDRNVVMHDYNRTADLNAPEDIDATTQDLAINQEKYFNFALEDLDSRQSSISGSTLVDIKSSGAGRKVAEELDAFVHNQLNGAAGNSLLANVARAAFNKNFINTVKKVAAIRGLNRAGLVAIVTPEVVEKIENEVADGNYGDIVRSNTFASGASQDPTTDVASFVFGIGGIRFYQSNLVEMRETNAGATPQTGRGTVSQVWVYNPADLALVVQVNQVETYRLEKRFATGVKGLVNFGAKLLNAGNVQKVLIND